MAQGRARETHSTDYLNPELTGVVEFEQIMRNTLASVQPVSDREFDLTSDEGKLAYEQFMNERIVITIHETTDKNEPTHAYVGDNGVGVWIPRGRPVRLPRKYVETLARSQIRAYYQERDPNPHADEGIITKRRGGAAYPLSVLEDKNPKGRAWLQRVTHESA